MGLICRECVCSTPYIYKAGMYWRGLPSIVAGEMMMLTFGLANSGVNPPSPFFTPGSLSKRINHTLRSRVHTLVVDHTILHM